MEVGLGQGQGQILLDGNPAPIPPKKGAQQSPNFRPMSIVAKWMDGSRYHLVRSPDHIVTWGPRSPHKQGHREFSARLVWPNGRPAQHLFHFRCGFMLK